jgi:hypothetical protein
LTDEEQKLMPLIRRAIRRAGEIDGAEVVSKRYKRWAVDVIPGLAGLLESPGSAEEQSRPTKRGRSSQVGR